MRNMFLTSAIGLSAMAFSNTFSKYSIIIRIAAICIFLYSMGFGYISARNFKHYIKHIKGSQLPNIYRSQLNEWNDWITLTYIYMLIVFTLIGMIIWRKIT